MIYRWKQWRLRQIETDIKLCDALIETYSAVLRDRIRDTYTLDTYHFEVKRNIAVQRRTDLLRKREKLK